MEGFLQKNFMFIGYLFFAVFGFIIGLNTRPKRNEFFEGVDKDYIDYLINKDNLYVKINALLITKIEDEKTNLIIKSILFVKLFWLNFFEKHLMSNLKVVKYPKKKQYLFFLKISKRPLILSFVMTATFVIFSLIKTDVPIANLLVSLYCFSITIFLGFLRKLRLLIIYEENLLEKW